MDLPAVFTYLTCSVICDAQYLVALLADLFRSTMILSCPGLQEEFFFVVVVKLSNAAPRAVADAVMCQEDSRCTCKLADAYETIPTDDDVLRSACTR